MKKAMGMWYSPRRLKMEAKSNIVSGPKNPRAFEFFRLEYSR